MQDCMRIKGGVDKWQYQRTEHLNNVEIAEELTGNLRLRLCRSAHNVISQSFLTGFVLIADITTAELRLQSKRQKQNNFQVI